MADDTQKPQGALRRAVRALSPAYFTVILLLTGVWFAVTFFGDPQAGMASVKITVAPPVAVAAKKTEEAAKPAPPAKTEPAAPPKDGLIEQTAQGPLPRIAADGTTPMQAYAGVAPAGKEPRIAIIVGGFGINPKASLNALTLLPAGVTFAFIPYAFGADQMAMVAHQKGHEILVQIPMEPYDYPDNDAGPYTLRTSSDDVSNMQRLVWVLTRMGGYTGAMPLMGEKFLTDPSSISPVLSFLARRGLLFIDNHAGRGGASGVAAGKAGTAYGHADVAIDDVPDATAIDRQLAELEKIARAKGRAIGYARLYPVTIDRISRWQETLAAKGVVLAPASAVVSAPKPVSSPSVAKASK
ncbi:MAG: divergent polysaccharide deacetylase family protein [Rhizomicrobium sp.]